MIRRKRDSLTAALKRAKAAGVTRAEAEFTMVTGYRENAKRQGWRPSELAATLAELDDKLNRVYGPKVTT